jgi:choloylglycine hydrolase
MRSVSVLITMADMDNPNISTTMYRMYADCDARGYCWDNAYDPSMFWVDFDKINIDVGAEPARLNVAGVVDLSSNVSEQFVPTTPFEFLK